MTNRALIGASVLSRSLTIGNPSTRAALGEGASRRRGAHGAEGGAPAVPVLRAAAIVVLAVAEAARHPHRLAVAVGGNHRVHAVGLAGAAEVLE